MSAPTICLALIAPPTSTVPPSSLGGLNMVRWLAEGLADRGHQVALIGADLGGLVSQSYTVVDTDPTGGHPATPELVDRLHAEQAGHALEQLHGVQAVGDHTRTGYLPAAGHPLATAQTMYEPLASPLVGPWPALPARPPLAHLVGGYVAVSNHQQANALGLPWLDVVHPGVPIAEHPLSLDHDGPCVYLGPLQVGHGARAALEAAHAAGRPLVLAGTEPGEQARAYAEVELRPYLDGEDQLLEQVSLSERWDLLAGAHCLLGLVRYDTPNSLEILEAIAYGTPVVTMAGTVGAELVTHGTSGLVLMDRALLPEAIGKAGRLDPKEIREQASRFDIAVMVERYEALFRRLLGGR